MESILTSVKKLLGIEEEYEHFDPEIIMHINSAFLYLNQLGVGPREGFSIQGSTETLTDFIGDRTDLEAIKTYLYLRVRLLFDPPQMGYLVDAITKQITELEWRFNIQMETTDPSDLPYKPTSPPSPGETRAAYVGIFTKKDFINLTYTIPLAVHKTGMNPVVESIEVHDTYYKNVICDYRILLNGSVRILSNVPFDGRIILREAL